MRNKIIALFIMPFCLFAACVTVEVDKEIASNDTMYNEELIKSLDKTTEDYENEKRLHTKPKRRKTGYYNDGYCPVISLEIKKKIDLTRDGINEKFIHRCIKNTKEEYKSKVEVLDGKTDAEIASMDFNFSGDGEYTSGDEVYTGFYKPEIKVSYNKTNKIILLHIDGTFFHEDIRGIRESGAERYLIFFDGNFINSIDPEKFKENWSVPKITITEFKYKACGSFPCIAVYSHYGNEIIEYKKKLLYLYLFDSENWITIYGGEKEISDVFSWLGCSTHENFLENMKYGFSNITCGIIY